MSLAVLMTLDADTPPRRRGLTPRERRRRIKVARDRIARGLSVRECSAIHRIAPATVLDWTRQALRWPECADLRDS